MRIQVYKRTQEFTKEVIKARRQCIQMKYLKLKFILIGKLTADSAKKKFKSLRDTHRRLIADEHRASGSGRVETKEKWKFYKSCKFLRDSCLIRLTSSNVPDNFDENDHGNHHNTSMNDSESITDSSLRKDEDISTSKKLRKQSRESQETDTLNSLTRIADKICTESIPPALPPPPTIN